MTHRVFLYCDLFSCFHAMNHALKSTVFEDRNTNEVSLSHPTCPAAQLEAKCGVSPQQKQGSKK